MEAYPDDRQQDVELANSAEMTFYLKDPLEDYIKIFFHAFDPSKQVQNLAKLIIIIIDDGSDSKERLLKLSTILENCGPLSDQSLDQLTQHLNRSRYDVACFLKCYKFLKDFENVQDKKALLQNFDKEDFDLLARVCQAKHCSTIINAAAFYQKHVEVLCFLNILSENGDLQLNALKEFWSVYKLSDFPVRSYYTEKVFKITEELLPDAIRNCLDNELKNRSITEQATVLLKFFELTLYKVIKQSEWVKNLKSGLENPSINQDQILPLLIEKDSSNSGLHCLKFLRDFERVNTDRERIELFKGLNDFSASIYPMIACVCEDKHVHTIVCAAALHPKASDALTHVLNEVPSAHKATVFENIFLNNEAFDAIASKLNLRAQNKLEEEIIIQLIKAIPEERLSEEDLESIVLRLAFSEVALPIAEDTKKTENLTAFFTSHAKPKTLQAFFALKDKLAG